MDKPDQLILSVKLESGQFETALRIPFPCSLDDGKAALDKWFNFAMAGLRIGASEMDATFDDKKRAAIIEEVAEHWDKLAILQKMWSGADVAKSIRELTAKATP